MQEVTIVLWRKMRELSVIDDFRPETFGLARMEALTFLRDRPVFGDDVLALLTDEAEDVGLARDEAFGSPRGSVTAMSPSAIAPRDEPNWAGRSDFM